MQLEIVLDRENDFFRYRIENTTISSYVTGGSSSGDQLPDEDIGLDFSKEGDDEGEGGQETSGQVTTPSGRVRDIGNGGEDGTVEWRLAGGRVRNARRISRIRIGLLGLFGRPRTPDS